MNSVSPGIYLTYPEAFVPGTAMIVNAALLIVGCGVSNESLGL